MSQCIEDVIPKIGPLFDSMKDGESEEQPTAAAALSRYNEICSSLSDEDMEREVAAVRWTDGMFNLSSSLAKILLPSRASRVS